MDEKSYTIKVPVFSTETRIVEDGLVGIITYEEMICKVKQKLEYKRCLPITIPARNKTKETKINQITCKNILVGDIPALFVQISAYDTNIHDGYIQGEKKEQNMSITKNVKIGNNSNFILIYPVINHLKNPSCFYLLFVYEPPTKDSGSVATLARIISKQILGEPIKNVKLDKVLSELAVLPSLPELQVSFLSFSCNEDPIEPKLKPYLVTQKNRLLSNALYHCVPIRLFQSILENKQTAIGERTIKVTVGKKEYRINDLLEEAQAEVKRTTEIIFNATSPITKEELDTRVHDEDFIIKKLKEIVLNYVA